MQQGKHGKGKLQREHYLAQREQIGDAAVAAQSDDQDRRQNSESAGDKPSHPRLDPPVHEPFHYYLAGERPRNRAALAGSQKRDREQRAGHCRT